MFYLYNHLFGHQIIHLSTPYVTVHHIITHKHIIPYIAPRFYLNKQVLLKYLITNKFHLLFYNLVLLTYFFSLIYLSNVYDPLGCYVDNTIKSYI
jgi:hypothetical protein